MSTSEWTCSSALVDAHVHFYACFERDEFLEAAARNFSAAAVELGLEDPPPGVLLMTEAAEDRFFHAFRESAGRGPDGRWTFELTAEEPSLLVRRAGKPLLALVAGRQIVTAEALEVLALGCDAEFEDGRSIDRTVNAARRAGAVVAVPWGFGKWWLGRGRVVAELLREQGAPDFFLGDNGGRLRYGSRPRLFGEAERRGVRILPGTDPLPFARHAARVGSYGFRLDGPLDLRRPAEEIKRRLRDPGCRPVTYGRRAPLRSFLRDQLAMQVRKRLGSRAR